MKYKKLLLQIIDLSGREIFGRTQIFQTAASSSRPGPHGLWRRQPGGGAKASDQGKCTYCPLRKEMGQILFE